ncbi:MAG TPA: hypothetical protein PLP16_09720 [Smithellaceae bacterium]|nr:hypothetical protein [Smithellaceae bacterium]
MTAIQSLWTDEGKEALAFLHGKGLTDDTIRAAGLGYNPTDLFLERQSWGLPAEVNENTKPKKLWLPAGIVIPRFINGEICRLRIRRTAGEPRYVLVSGSVTIPMTWNLERNVIIVVESELDGLLLNQEAGDLVGIVAMGTATAKPDNVTHAAFKRADKILVSLDADDAGVKASWSFWPETYGAKVKRWPCIRGKDPSESWRNGLNIRAWIMAAIGMVVDSEKTENAATEHQTSSADVQLTACFSCGGKDYWMRQSGSKWICACCHPPATEAIVFERRQL